MFKIIFTFFVFAICLVRGLVHAETTPTKLHDGGSNDSQPPQKTPVQSPAAELQSPSFSKVTLELLDGMTNDVGDTCRASPTTFRPDTNNTLLKVDGEIAQLIKQYGEIVEEEKADKQNPVSLGPPETMKLAMDPKMPGVLMQYYALTRQGRGHRPPVDKELRKKEIEKTINGMFPNASTPLGPSEIYKAALISIKINETRYPNTSGRGGGKVYHSLGGVKGDEKYFYQSVETSAQHLPKMEKYLVDLKDKTETQKLVMQTIVTGLASGGITAGLNGWRKLVHSGIGRGVRIDNAAATGASISASQSIWTLVSQDLSNYVTGQIKSNTIAGINTALQLVTEQSAEALKSAGNLQGTLNEADQFIDSMGESSSSKETAKEETPTILNIPTASDLPNSPPPIAPVIDPKQLTFVHDASKPMFIRTSESFTKSMFQIREATTAILQNPSLMENSYLNQFSNAQGSSNEATKLAFLDGRQANASLVSSLRAFDDAGGKLEDVTKNMLEMLKQKKVGKNYDTSRIVDGEHYFQSMLSAMDLTVGHLSDQRTNFGLLKIGIQKACDNDQRSIFDKWGTGLPLLGGWTETEGSYLAKAMLAHSDCVYKKSLMRSAELLKIAQVITHLKGTCAQLITWDKGVRMMTKMKDRIRQ